VNDSGCSVLYSMYSDKTSKYLPTIIYKSCMIISDFNLKKKKILITCVVTYTRLYTIDYLVKQLK